MKRFFQLVLLTPLCGLCLVSELAAQQRDTTRQRRQEDPDTAAMRRMLRDRIGRPVSNEEIVERLRQSGMTRSQVRSRLQQLGYDPSLADRYFDMLERGGEAPRGEASRDFISALERVGISVPGLRVLGDTIVVDTLDMDTIPTDTLAKEDDDAELRVFGSELFRRGHTEFDPVVYGPVDRDYRLGPGDELMLVLTGDVEDAYTMEVTREGIIVIPDVGQVAVNGLTLQQLEDVLHSRLARVYSGVARSPNARTRFSISLGRLRVNQVFLIGEVSSPGAYQVSAAATVFNALYRAGGPRETGSFRSVVVNRAGGARHLVDLYDYLLYGEARADVRLEHGDRVFVPPVGPQVTVEGSVRRPAIYELRGEEGLREVIGFAGGPKADAVVTRIQIDRILPPGERQPGVVRVLRDVDLELLFSSEQQFRLQDGDIVRLFSVPDKVRNRVWITGEIRLPGTYEWNQGTTLEDLVGRANGLTETAYRARVHIYRMNEEDGSRRLIRAPLGAGPAGAAELVPLLDGDSVVVLSREQLTNVEYVRIEGFVKDPGEYVLAEGMTLKDLILAAQGFVHGAHVAEAEVSRFPDPVQRTDTTAVVYRVTLDSPRDFQDNGDGTYVPRSGVSPGVPIWAPATDEFRLLHGDRVYIRKAPGYDDMREVWLTGEVMLPGRYVLERRDERVASLIARAGGLTREAYPGGVHVVRRGQIVGADLQRALNNPSDRNNIAVEAGDSIHVPAYDPTVAVTGAVTFSSRVLHRQGAGLAYYIEQAGGYAENADRGRVTITYPNGERASPSGGFLMFARNAKIPPGSMIFVAPRPEGARGGVTLDQFLSRTVTVLSGLATLFIVINQAR